MLKQRSLGKWDVSSDLLQVAMVKRRCLALLTPGEPQTLTYMYTMSTMYMSTVHEYNEVFNLLHVYRIKTEAVRVMCKGH